VAAVRDRDGNARTEAGLARVGCADCGSAVVVLDDRDLLDKRPAGQANAELELGPDDRLVAAGGDDAAQRLALREPTMDRPGVTANQRDGVLERLAQDVVGPTLLRDKRRDAMQGDQSVALAVWDTPAGDGHVRRDDVLTGRLGSRHQKVSS
jgi:hypothetical protein